MGPGMQRVMGDGGKIVCHGLTVKAGANVIQGRNGVNRDVVITVDDIRRLPGAREFRDQNVAQGLVAHFCRGLFGLLNTSFGQVYISPRIIIAQAQAVVICLTVTHEPKGHKEQIC